MYIAVTRYERCTHAHLNQQVTYRKPDRRLVLLSARPFRHYQIMLLHDRGRWTTCSEWSCDNETAGSRTRDPWSPVGRLTTTMHIDTDTYKRTSDKRGKSQQNLTTLVISRRRLTIVLRYDTVF